MLFQFWEQSNGAILDELYENHIPVQHPLQFDWFE